MSARYRHLEGFELSGCAVRTSAILGFPGQRWVEEDDDPLDHRNTAVFFHYPRKPLERRWAAVGIGGATGVHVCAPFLPAERWVFLTEDGRVYVVGGGDNGFEDPIPGSPNLHFCAAKAVRGGHALAVGPRRKVYLRRAPGDWVKLDQGLFPDGELTDPDDAGFEDIDGFGEQDLWACGGEGDLWRFDGEVWTQIPVPGAPDLSRICCAGDDHVYLIADGLGLLRGHRERPDRWEPIPGPGGRERLESLVWYGDRLLVSTLSELYALEDGALRVAWPDMPPLRRKAHLAAGDGVLLVAGRDEAALLEGGAWRVILEPEHPASTAP